MGLNHALHGRALCGLFALWIVVGGVGCGTTPQPPTAAITGTTVTYQPGDGPILGATDDGKFVVTSEFIEQAFKDARRVKLLERRIRENELRSK